MNIFFAECTPVHRRRISLSSFQVVNLRSETIFPSSSLPFRGVGRLINFLPFLPSIPSPLAPAPTFYADVSLFTSPLLFLSVLALVQFPSRAALPFRNPGLFTRARLRITAISSGWTANSSRGCNCHDTNYRGPTSSGSKTILESYAACQRRCSHLPILLTASFFFFFFFFVVVVVESLLRKNGIPRS